MLIIVLSAVVLTVSTVVGTLAYFTSSVEIVNTFTVGKVALKLDEAVTDENGVAEDVTFRTESGRNYKMLPGNSYYKDPTVTVKGGSDASYVRVIIAVNNADVINAIVEAEKNGLDGKFEGFLIGWDKDNWEYVGRYDNVEEGEIGFELRYRTDSGAKITTASDADQKLPTVFTGIRVPGAINAQELAAIQDLSVRTEAHAIQASGFDNNEDGAWAAFEAQMNG